MSDRKIGIYFNHLLSTHPCFDLCSQTWNIELREMDEREGHCQVLDNLVVIDPENAKSRLPETLLHEILHAIMNVTGLDSKLEDGQEEDILRSISPILYDFLKRNKLRFDYD